MADRYYTLHIAGCTRNLPILNVTDKLAIAGFVMLGDVELTDACAQALAGPDDAIATAANLTHRPSAS